MKKILAILFCFTSLFAQGYDKLDEPMPVELVRKANYGDSQSQYILGALHYKASLTNNDSKRHLNRSVLWLKASAMKKNSDALFFLASLYLKGEGVKRDGVKAVALYGKAKEYGNENAERFMKDSYNTLSPIEKKRVPFLSNAQVEDLLTYSP